jgi:hypothetical protein
VADWYRDHHVSPEVAGEAEYRDWAQSAGASVDVAGTLTWPDQTPEYVRCRCRWLGSTPSGEEPSDVDDSACPVHVQPELPDNYEHTDPEELF